MPFLPLPRPSLFGERRWAALAALPHASYCGMNVKAIELFGGPL